MLQANGRNNYGMDQLRCQHGIRISFERAICRFVFFLLSSHTLINSSYLRQAVLSESLLLDPEIVWKGSVITDREKDESVRRITLVKVS